MIYSHLLLRWKTSDPAKRERILIACMHPTWYIHMQQLLPVHTGSASPGLALVNFFSGVPQRNRVDSQHATLCKCTQYLHAASTTQALPVIFVQTMDPTKVWSFDSLHPPERVIQPPGQRLARVS